MTEWMCVVGYIVVGLAVHVAIQWTLPTSREPVEIAVRGYAAVLWPLTGIVAVVVVPAILLTRLVDKAKARGTKERIEQEGGG